MERYVVHVTKACNLNCLYCYEKDKTSTYSWEEVKELVDTICKGNKEFGVEFLGGEPVLAFDLIEKAYNRFEENAKQYGLKIHDYIITTNGTILNEEIIDFLVNNPKVVWAVSIDGNKFTNQLRVFKNSNINSYDVVIENSKNLFKSIPNRVTAHIVTHPYNVAYLSEAIEDLYNQGFKSIGIGIIESTMQIGREFCEEFIKELDYVSNLIIQGYYPGLYISEFEWLKPKSDQRKYIRDNSGKVVAETYGRAIGDFTETTKEYDIQKGFSHTQDIIHFLREAVYTNHQRKKVCLTSIA